MSGWLLHWTDDHHGHVLPIADQTDHTLNDDGDCVCGPTMERVDASGPDVWLATHHSLDGREAHE